MGAELMENERWGEGMGGGMGRGMGGGMGRGMGGGMGGWMRRDGVKGWEFHRRNYNHTTLPPLH